MKTIYSLCILVIFSFISCNSTSTQGKISGTQSEMGKVGTAYNVSVIGVTGVSNFQATVQSSSNNVTTVNASLTITNTKLLQILQNYPGDFTVSGGNVSLKGLQVKNLSDGVEKTSGMHPGVIVNYSSSLGATYPIDGSSAVRTVTLVNQTDSYAWNGMYIKTIEVTEPVNQYGIKDVIYIANHKWGIVGIKVNFDDLTYVMFPVTCSKNN